jgi:hypothetical protein
MWFASQLGSAVSAAYHESSTLQLKGALQSCARDGAAATRRSARALRTTFTAGGELRSSCRAGNVSQPCSIAQTSGGSGARRTRRSA